MSERNYALSSANILSPSTVHLALTMNTEEHIDHAKKSGFEKIEWWPIITLQSDLDAGKIKGSHKKCIASAHQSFRAIRSGLAESIILPEKLASLESLSLLSDEVPDIPYVLYESENQKFPVVSQGSALLVQIRKETCELWKVCSVEAVIDRALSEGFTGICLGTSHLARTPLENNWKHTFKTLSDSNMLYEVHLEVSRIDLGLDQNCAEVRDLLENTRDTQIKPKLEYLNDIGWNGLLTLELTSDVVKKVKKVRAPLVSRQLLAETNLEIRKTLYSIFEYPNGGD